jgi:hypothetical protein
MVPGSATMDSIVWRLTDCLTILRFVKSGLFFAHGAFNVGIDLAAFGAIEANLNESHERSELLDSQIRIMANAVHEFLVTRDAFENTDLFARISDRALRVISTAHAPGKIESENSGDSVALEYRKSQEELPTLALQDDPELYQTFLDLKNFHPVMPYGSNVCKQTKAPVPLDSKSVSECFLRQDTFVDSVKASREQEMVCRSRFPDGECVPVTHAIKKVSLEPCGTVLGLWQASRSGGILRNDLMVTVPGVREPISFDSEVLRTLIRKIDGEISK